MKKLERMEGIYGPYRGNLEQFYHCKTWEGKTIGIVNAIVPKVGWWCTCWCQCPQANHPKCIAHKWIMDDENTKAKTKMNEGIIHTKRNTFFLRVKFPCMKKLVESKKLFNFLFLFSSFHLWMIINIFYFNFYSIF